MVEKDGTRSSEPVHPLIAKRSLRKFQLQNLLGFVRRSVAGAPCVRCGRARNMPTQWGHFMVV